MEAVLAMYGWLPSDWLLFGKMDWELGLIGSVVEKLGIVYGIINILFVTLAE